MKTTIASIGFAFLSVMMQAQTALLAGGGTTQGSSGSVSYSIGQVSYSESSVPEGSIQEGVQQPYEIAQVSLHPSMSDIEIGVFPNPAHNQLTIRIPSFQTGFQASLFDSSGSLIQLVNLNSSTTSIEVGTWSQGTYFIELSDSIGRHARYKLVKN
jgi:Secretion system C-terminal sorting domain